VRLAKAEYGANVPNQRKGTAQIVAHFTYIAMKIWGDCPEDMLLPHSRLGLRSMRDEPRDVPRRLLQANSKTCEFWSAVSAGNIRIVKAMGRSYGAGALTIVLENVSNIHVTVAMLSGTVFEHISWCHEQ
jgi:hypothetical protein